MKKIRQVLAMIALAIAAAGSAEAPPDSRIAAITPASNEDIPLRTAPGSHMAVIFEAGETIQSVIVSDPAAIVIGVAPQGDSFTVSALRSTPNPNLVVRTTKREYRFRLVFGPKDDVVYAVRILAVSAPETDRVEPANVLPTDRGPDYVLKGDAGLKPVRVSDDGQRTYIEWAPNQPLPAVFAINALGDEETLDSTMRGDVMVIDRVYPKLVFRMGRHRAEAIRPAARKRGKG